MARIDFIGRTRELEILEDEYSNPQSFVLMTGRRRVGKTRLIKEFIRNKDALYFYCNKVNTRSILDELSASIAQYSDRTYGEFRDWKEAFSAFAHCKDGKKLLVIDEFQNMIYADKDIIAYMQDILDNTLSGEEVMVILCGSHISIMDNLAKDYKSPLYGRFTRHMRISQLPFHVLKDDDYIGSLERYAVHGGVPKYMELLRDGDLENAIRKDVMSPSAMMFDDIMFILNDELREPASYMSIMKSIAHGNHKISDIASNLQIPVTSLVKPLDRLMEMGFIRRDVPINEDPERSRNGLYVFDDNYSAFYFEFVGPFRSSLELDDTDGAMEYWKKHFSEHLVAFVFEEECRRSVYRMSKDIGFIPRKVGRYWDKHCEIDVVALDTDSKKAFVAECKYHRKEPMGPSDLNRLMAKAESVKELHGYDIGYGLFSVSGFTDPLFDRDVLLVNKGVVVNDSR